MQQITWSVLESWPHCLSGFDLGHIARHYHWSHPSVNPHRIVPIGPALDLEAPHGRERLGPEALG